MALAARLRKYAVASRIAARNSASTSRNVIAGMCSSGVTLVTLFAIYGYVFDIRGEVRGIGVATALWAIGMYSVYWAVGMRNVFRDMADDVKQGSVEVLLNKPVDYIFLTVAQRFGRQIWTLLASIVIIVSLLFVFTGPTPIDFSWLWFVQFVLLLLFGLLLSAIGFSLIGLSAFWIDDPTPVMWMFDKGVMVLGGALLPVALFPPVVRYIAEWSPMGAMLSFSQAFNPDFPSRFPHLFASQVLWCVVFGLITVAVWHRAKKILSVYGG
ncbi:ABC-2 family transporter protein [Candidatus Uhrbacteria bacterium]|nr:ABC-2 family transporter protein [Candidatus Uhrbacteria bacterium]